MQTCAVCGDYARSSGPVVCHIKATKLGFAGVDGNDYEIVEHYVDDFPLNGDGVDEIVKHHVDVVLSNGDGGDEIVGDDDMNRTIDLIASLTSSNILHVIGSPEFRKAIAERGMSGNLSNLSNQFKSCTVDGIGYGINELERDSIGTNQHVIPQRRPNNKGKRKQGQNG